MMLLIDIGNTCSKFAMTDVGEMQLSQSIEHPDLSRAELGGRFPEGLVLESVWASCVGPEEVYATIEQWVNVAFGLPINRVSVSDADGRVTNNYQEPEKLGVDRWVGAVGAREKIPTGDVLIVDMGTAVTIDWLDKEDVYQGGVIIPGYDLMHRSLTGNTAGIDSHPEPTEQVIGKTTQQCVNAGLSYAIVGAVDKIISEMSARISSPVRLIVTGGGAPLWTKKTDFNYLYEPQLLMYGLLRLAVSKL